MGERTVRIVDADVCAHAAGALLAHESGPTPIPVAKPIHTHCTRNAIDVPGGLAGRLGGRSLT
jgi:hypothetical protein